MPCPTPVSDLYISGLAVAFVLLLVQFLAEALQQGPDGIVLLGQRLLSLDSPVTGHPLGDGQMGYSVRLIHEGSPTSGLLIPLDSNSPCFWLAKNLSLNILLRFAELESCCWV